MIGLVVSSTNACIYIAHYLFIFYTQIGGSSVHGFYPAFGEDMQKVLRRGIVMMVWHIATSVLVVGTVNVFHFPSAVNILFANKRLLIAKEARGNAFRSFAKITAAGKSDGSGHCGIA